MKKLACLSLAIIFLLLSSVSFTSCGPTKKQLKKYFENEDNYELLTLRVLSIDNDGQKLRAIIVDGNTDFSYGDDNTQTFCFYGDVSNILKLLNENDIVSVISASKCFYDGYCPPIVHLETDGKTLLDFYEGQENLLNWVENEYKK